jgi:hypothetical protein
MIIKLDDDQKRALAERLVREGYLVRDQDGRYLLTRDGNLAGQMLYACAVWHQQEGEKLAGSQPVAAPKSH